MNLLNAATLVTGALAVAGGIASSAHADKLTFPFTIDAKTKLPVVEIKIGGTTIKALADTGFNDRMIFSKDAAATLKLPDNGKAGGVGGIGAAATNNTKVAAGAIVGAMGADKVAPVAGGATFLPNVNLPFDAVVGAEFLRTDDKNGAFILNSATGKASILNKAQAEKLAVLPLQTPTTAVASGTLIDPAGATTPASMVTLMNGPVTDTASFILSTGVSDTLISKSLADKLGPLTSAPTEELFTELGALTVPTVVLKVQLFANQSPITMDVAVLSANFDPTGVNAIGMDVFDQYSAVIWNGATSTFSASVVPEPPSWAAFTLGVAGVGAYRRRRRSLSYLT